jgi:hypothetical protein
MADVIRHARSVSPYFYPNKGGSASDLHGITSIAGGASVATEDVFVVGKKEKCGTIKETPESTVPITQLERGEINSYLTLANLDAEPGVGLTLEDFSNGLTDVIFYERDSFEGTIERTVWFPKTAIESLGIDIADPEARIERTFDLAGDNKRTLREDNLLLIVRSNTAPSGTSGNYVITGTTIDPAPASDPNNSGQFILRVDRTRDSNTVTLDITTDYTYDDGANELTIIDGQDGDVYRIYYSAITFGSPGDPTTTDPCPDPSFITADSVTVLISDGTTELEIDCLTSLSLSASLNRIEESCIGEDERVLREIEDTPVDVSLTGRVRTSELALAFMQKLGTTHGITDAKLYEDTVRITVKVYSDATKSNFLIGYQVDNLTFNDDTEEFTANEFGTIDLTASSSEMLITTNESNLT